MDHRIETSRNVLLNELEKINQAGSLNPDSLCNMGKIIDGLHHIEEIRMYEEVGDYPETYERSYGRTYDNGGYGYSPRRARRMMRGNYDRGYDRGYGNDGDMHSFLEESMRKASTEQERERIRRLMEAM